MATLSGCGTVGGDPQPRRKASARNLSVIRQAYNLGQLRLLDVLNEQRRLLETELTYIDAESEPARSRAELERAVGGDLQ